MKTQRILELDGLRAFAVMFVVIYHMTNISGAVPSNSYLVRSAIASLGEGGVHIFFVISGFIITSLLIREIQTKGYVSLSAFYTRRFLRIIPPLAVYLFVLFTLCQLKYLSINPINFLWSLLFLGNLELWGNPISTASWFVSHTWSLSVEEQYYLILPPILVSVLGFRFKSINILLIGLFCLCIGSLKLAKEASIHLNPSLIKLTSLYSSRYIIVGVMIALHRETVKRILHHTSALVPVFLISVIAVAGIDQPLINPFIAKILNLLFAGIEPICYGFLVLWFVENPDKCAFLRWRWIQWLGACSYSIYLWQQLFTGKSHFYNGFTIAQSPLAIIAILACATLSYYFVEKPSIKLTRFIFTKKVPLSYGVAKTMA